jgi:hypothetical protein
MFYFLVGNTSGRRKVKTRIIFVDVICYSMGYFVEVVEYIDDTVYI